MAKGKFPGMPGNMNNMMKQVQKMQKQMQEMQEEIEQREVEASAGGGAVVVKVNGKRELLNIAIQPEVVDPDDIEMLQDLILAAANEALRKAEEMMTKEMGKITGGLNLPGMF
ncbi:MAG: YbaB/EbfC family nucleoid-associated protein [Bacillota bacterium]